MQDTTINEIIMFMSNPNGYPQSPECKNMLEGILRQHTIEQFRTGIYASWIDLVDKYFSDEYENQEEQEKLSAFARSEMPLAATVWREIDNRFPGVHSYFLTKVDIETGDRVKYGTYGTEPIFVARVDNNGNIIEIPGKGRPEAYTNEQVQVVVRQAHELEAAGFVLNPRPVIGEDFVSRGRSVRL